MRQSFSSGRSACSPSHHRVLTYLEIAKEFKSPILRIVTDTNTFKPDPGQVVEIVRKLTGPLEAAGVVLAIENHDRFTAPTLASMIHSIASPWVGICLDTVNSFGALEPPETVIETLGPLAVNLHRVRIGQVGRRGKCKPLSFAV
jgi:sugar phosphate isomerase/epimerase